MARRLIPYFAIQVPYPGFNHREPPDTNVLGDLHRRVLVLTTEGEGKPLISELDQFRISTRAALKAAHVKQCLQSRRLNLHTIR